MINTSQTETVRLQSGAGYVLAASLLLLITSYTHAIDSGCAEPVDPRESGLPLTLLGQPRVVCAAFFPFAVALDGFETTRLEVRINGSGVAAAAFSNTFPVIGIQVDGVALPQTGEFIDLFDDGNNGMRLSTLVDSGDGS